MLSTGSPVTAESCERRAKGDLLVEITCSTSPSNHTWTPCGSIYPWCWGGRRKHMLEDAIGAGQGALDVRVALAGAAVALHILVWQDLQLARREGIDATIWMDDRRIVVEGMPGIEHRGQLLVLDLHQRSGRFGRLVRLSGNR